MIFSVKLNQLDTPLSFRVQTSAQAKKCALEVHPLSTVEWVRVSA